VLACDGKRWARKSSSKEFDAPVRAAIERIHVLSKNLPVWPVYLQRLREVPVDFNEGLMSEASLFKTDSLAARAGAELN